MEEKLLLLENVLDKLSSMDDKIDNVLSRVNENHLDHEHRITDVERRLNNGLSETQKKHGEQLDALHRRVDDIEEKLIAKQATDTMVQRQMTESTTQMRESLARLEQSIDDLTGTMTEKWSHAYIGLIVVLVSVVGFLLVSGSDLHLFKTQDDEVQNKMVMELWKEKHPNGTLLVPSQPVR